MKQQQLPAQQWAYKIAALAITQSVSEDVIQAMKRIKGTAVYLEADTNLIKNGVATAIKKINWENVLSIALAKYNIKPNSHQAQVLKRAIQIETKSNVEYWRQVDTIINHIASLESITSEELTEIDGIYSDSQPETDANPNIISTIGLYCPNMPPEQKRNFAKMLEQTIKKQIAIGTF